MYRIAHLSDFHLRNTSQDLESVMALIDHALSLKVDHLVVSGDIAEVAEPHIFDAFSKALDERGWLCSNRATIVPEDHDVFPFSTKKRNRVGTTPRRHGST